MKIKDDCAKNLKITRKVNDLIFTCMMSMTVQSSVGSAGS